MSIVAAFAVPHPPLIIPGVADDEREQIPDTVAAYKEVGRRIARLKPETIVISSPHAETHLDYLHISGGVGASGNFARFGAPHARYSATYDQRFVRELCNEAEAEGIAAGTVGERSPELDHGTMIPWHFAREGWRHAAQEGELPANTLLPLLVRMSISGLSLRSSTTAWARPRSMSPSAWAAAWSTSRRATSRTSSRRMGPLAWHPKAPSLMPLPATHSRRATSSSSSPWSRASASARPSAVCARSRSWWSSSTARP